MPPLPVVSGAEFIRAMGKLGYRATRQRGSHVHLACPGRESLTVPQHSELDRGLLRALVRTAGISVDELLALL